MERNEGFFRQSIDNSTLGNILNSITAELEIPPSGLTFAYKLINALDRERFISEMKSLTKGVVVHTKVRKHDEYGRVYAYEVQIIPRESKLVVTKQDENKWEEFLQANKHDEVRVILIKSDSLPIVEAKREVYKALRDHINSENLFLHHVLEEYDEIAKMSFHKKLSSFSCNILDLSKNIPIPRLTNIIMKAGEDVFTRRNIRHLCHSAIIRNDGSIVGTADDRPYVCYSMFTIRKLKKCLVEETLKKIGESLGSNICTGILQYIESEIKRKLRKNMMHVKLELTEALFNRIPLTFLMAVWFIFPLWLSLLVAVSTFLVTSVMFVDVNSDAWRNRVADEIFEKINAHRNAIVRRVLTDIETLCKETSSNLKTVAESMLAHQKEIQLVNQMQWLLHHIQTQNRVHSETIETEQITAFMNKELAVALWEKRKGMHFEDWTLLKNYPNILKCIAGYSGNEKQVLKVFLRGKDPSKNQKGEEGTPGSLDWSEILQIKEELGDIHDFQFEIVYVETKAEEIKKQAQKIRRIEKDSPAIDDSTWMKLGQIIQKHCDRIHASYSNVIGIGISQVRCDGTAIKKEPCIVLYCLDKSIIPFGEKPLPGQIEGIHCDSREDFVMFGMCPNPCPAFDRDLPEPGCSIGIPSKESSGSVGFLVKQRNINDQTNCGFLTASHVALKDFKDLYNNGFLSQLKPDCGNLKIIHPFNKDGDTDNVVGHVVESFIGNYICTREDHMIAERKEGLDFALVTTTIRSEENRTTLSVFDEDHRLFTGNFNVVKLGKSTGTTKGKLMHGFLSIKVDYQFSAPGYFAFSNCYAIQESDEGPFFELGDSGSGVFVIDEDSLRPLGIAFAFLNSQTAVCRIDQIVKKLDLEIVGCLEISQFESVCRENRKAGRSDKPECMECS